MIGDTNGTHAVINAAKALDDGGVDIGDGVLFRGASSNGT